MPGFTALDPEVQPNRVEANIQVPTLANEQNPKKHYLGFKCPLSFYIFVDRPDRTEKVISHFVHELS